MKQHGSHTNNKGQSLLTNDRSSVPSSKPVTSPSNRVAIPLTQSANDPPRMIVAVAEAMSEAMTMQRSKHIHVFKSNESIKVNILGGSTNLMAPIEGLNSKDTGFVQLSISGRRGVKGAVRTNSSISPPNMRPARTDVSNVEGVSWY